MKKEKSCGAIVYNENKEVLIVKHNAGHWDFPKGHMEKGEDEYQTAIREVKEETNIDIVLDKDHRYQIHYNPKPDVQKTVVYYLANNLNNDLIKQDVEISNIGWFDYETAQSILTHNAAKKLLKRSFKDLD